MTETIQFLERWRESGDRRKWKIEGSSTIGSVDMVLEEGNGHYYAQQISRAQIQLGRFDILLAHAIRAVDELAK